MNGNGLRIGSFGGVPIIVDWTVAILAGYILISDFQRGGVGALPESIIYILALFVAILAHEMGHAGMAAAFRIPSTQIVLTFFGGYVQFVRPPAKRWHDMLVSAAGPGVNLALFATLTYLVSPGASDFLSGNPRISSFVMQSAYVNLLLGLFNLLPGYPLDGGAIVRAFLSYFLRTARARWVVAWFGVVIATALALFGLTNGMIWTIGIGLVLALSAFSEVNAAQRALGGAKRID